MRFSPDHRNDVGCDGYGHKIEHPFQIGASESVGDCKRLHEFIAHATSRKMGAWIRTPFEFGIKYGHCRRKSLVGHVVVADYKVDAQRAGIFYLFGRLDAAIKDNEELDPLTGSHVYGSLRYTISVLVARRDKIVDMGVEIAQVFIDECDGGCSVDVIITIDNNLLL